MIDLAPHIDAIARRLLGVPNAKLSTKTQLRFGTNGSIAVDIAGPERGKWFCFEPPEEGGGPLDLLRLKGGVANGEAVDWLRNELGIELDGDRERRHIDATYDYPDERGKLLYQAVRFEPKGFAQCRPDGRGGWLWNLHGVRRVLYRLPELLATPIEQTVYVAEGEKDVERLRALGRAATCNSEGAGKWHREFAELFRGRDVVVLPDNDDGGRKHAAAIVANISPVARRVRLVELPGLPPKGDVSNWLDAGNTVEEFDRLVAETAPVERAEATPNSSVLQLIHFEQMRPRLGDGYLIKNLLGSTVMAVMYGESGSGKTFFALHLALSLAAGAAFFGRRVRRVGAVYIAAEAGRGVDNRIAAAKHEIEFPGTMRFGAITTPIDLCSDGADLEKLIATIRAADIGAPVELIIIDTLSRVMAGGNENAPDDMGALVRNIDRLRDATGAAVLLVHHSGKDASRGARGHSLLRAATDTEIEVSRDEGSKIATAQVTKQRDYRTDGTLSFSLRQVELGVDGDGDPVTSCIVVEEAESDRASPTVTRLSPAQKRALELLSQAIDTAGEIPPANCHIPSGTRCVAEELWRRYCYEGAISSGDQHAKRMAFKRSAESLVALGRVGKWGDWVWLV